jgi:hypothetical protein
VFGDSIAKADRRWIDIYNSDEGWPGHRLVTSLVPDITGFEEEFRW